MQTRNEPTARRICLVTPAAIVLSVGWSAALLAHLSAVRPALDADGRPLGGDFLAFYAAGKLVAGGAAADLFDLRVQQSMQIALVGDRYVGLAAYLNPPAFAVLLAPLSLLSYSAAFTLHTLLMLAAAIGGLSLLRPHLPALAGRWPQTVALAVCYPPLILMIAGGQNTALSLLLICWAVARLLEGRDWAAGVALGLLAYKPQLAAPLMLLLVAQRRWPGVFAAAILVVVHYAVGAAVCGPAWPTAYLQMLETYWPLEDAANGAKSISLVGLMEALCGPKGRAAGGVMSAAFLVGLLLAVRRPWGRDARLATALAAAVSLTLLVSPHSQWYETALLLVPALLLLDQHLRGQPTQPAISPASMSVAAALAAGYLLSPLFAAGPILGWQPLVAWPMALLAWSARIWPAPEGEPDAVGLRGVVLRGG